MSNGSIISKKSQAPVAIVLSIMLALILVWRFGGGETAAAVETLPRESLNDQRVPMESLKEIVGRIGTEKFTLSKFEMAAPVLARDPFSSITFVRVVEDVDTGRRAEEDAKAARARRLGSLKLSGSIALGDERLALVNGRYVRQGDTLDGFTIKAIEERKLILEDDLGVEVIRFGEVFQP